MNVKVAYCVEKTLSEGPGKRFAIWFQGCSIRCKGCINQELWNFEGGLLKSTEEIIGKIEYSLKKHGIEGISFLGGEPFDQKEALYELLSGTKQIGLNSIIFTGYVYENLLKNEDETINKILKSADLLVDGPYVEALRTENLYLRGSSNQRLIFLSNTFSEDEFKRKNSFDLHYANGKMMIVGFPFNFINNGNK